MLQASVGWIGNEEGEGTSRLLQRYDIDQGYMLQLLINAYVE